MRYEIGRCRIPDILDKLGWTQRVLAEKSGVSEKTISSFTRHNNPRKNMTMEVSIALSDALGVHPRNLFELIPRMRSAR